MEVGMKARDLMRTDILVVTEDLGLEEAFDLFVERRVTGAPVVDGDGRLVGIITKEDAWFARMTKPDCVGGPPACLKVRDVMTTPAVSTPGDATVQHVAALMWRLHLHRIPVVEGGRVAGIVSSIDLCRMISESRRRDPVLVN